MRETFGALFGQHQARTAGDAEIAEIMQHVAEDETRHAALAYQIDAWIMPQLEPSARARVAAARAVAVLRLQRELEAPTSRALRNLAGIPDTSTTTQLLASLSGELWASPARGWG